MRNCARCGVNIDHRDKRSRHCSALCRTRDYEGSVIGIERNCAHCGSSFSPSKNPQVFCSRKCRSRADVARNREAYNRRNAERRARERNAVVGDPFTRLQVLDRDGWICQLCLTPIDWTLTGRGRFAPAVDHIVPLNKGGTHSFDNVWAAHSGCNASKGDRTDIVMMGAPDKEEPLCQDRRRSQPTSVLVGTPIRTRPQLSASS
jgi:5-methylcytosine-specific restriction endonuclease McrA